MVIVCCTVCGSPNCIEPKDEDKIEFMKLFKCYCCKEKVLVTKELVEYVTATRKLDEEED